MDWAEQIAPGSGDGPEAVGWRSRFLVLRTPPVPKDCWRLKDVSDPVRAGVSFGEKLNIGNFGSRLPPQASFYPASPSDRRLKARFHRSGTSSRLKENRGFFLRTVPALS